MTTSKYGDFRQFLEMQENTGAPDRGVEMLLENMSEEKARLLSLCAIPHQFSARVMRVLDLSLDEEEAQRRCDEFARLSIVSEGEFGLTLNDTARKRLFDKWLQPESSVEFRAANERLKNFLRQIEEDIAGEDIWAAQRSYIFHAIGADQDTGFAELAVRFNLASDQHVLDECEILVNLAYEYEPILSTNNLAWLRYFDARVTADKQRWKDAIELYTTILSTDGIDNLLPVKAHERLGIIYQINRNWEKSIFHLQQATRLALAEPGLTSSATRILQSVGAVYREKGDFDESERILKRCIKMNENPRNPIGLATSYNALGILYRRLRNSDQAINAFSNALKALGDAEDSYRVAQIHNNLGLTYADMSMWPESTTSFYASLSVKEKLDDKYGQGKTIMNLARFSVQRGDFDEAIQFSNKAIQLFSQLGARYSLAKAHRNIGKIYKAARNPQLADKHLRVAADMFRKIRDDNEAQLTEAELHAVHHKEKLPLPVKIILGIVGFIIFLLVLIG